MPMLTVHHLGKSQSERIVWLCEELGLPYELKIYDRDPVTRLAPPEYKALHPMGAAPVITTAAWCWPSRARSSNTSSPGTATAASCWRRTIPTSPHFVYWFHFANGTLQPATGRNMILSRLDLPHDNPMLRAMNARLDLALGQVQSRLAKVDYFAGSEFTTADIMIVFTLTTMRLFLPFGLAPYPAILGYLQRIGRRDAYQRAMRKGDPDLTPLLH